MANYGDIAASGQVMLDAFGYWLCLKVATKVKATFDAQAHETYLLFMNDEGSLHGCEFELKGNPYSLAPRHPRNFPVTFKSSSGEIDHASAPATLTGFTYGMRDADGVFHPAYEAKNLSAFSADDFLDILTTLPDDQSYQRFSHLFDGPTHVTGTNFADKLESGAGNDTINALGGNDIVNAWNAGNLTYRGGAGFDTLDFSTATGVYFPTDKVQALIIDLKTGKGQNPYGGTLKVDSVEKIIGTDAADKIYGSNKADWIETQDYGADLVKARGGNDTVVLWPFANGAKLDGGGGRDTLNTGFEYMENTLDLTDPSKNTGKFADGVIKNFEIFNFSSQSFDTGTTLHFKAGGGNETVTVSGQRTTTLDLGDGDNVAKGGAGQDTIIAGSGKDKLDGGAGDDFLTGGDDIDLFIFGLGHGKDVIEDFTAGGKNHDKIDLSAFSDIKNWADLKGHHLSEGSGNAMIDTSDQSTITLQGVGADALREGDFIFA